MSLDDRFNPTDGGIVDSIDSMLYEFHKDVVERWENTTDYDRSTLATGLYAGSFLSFAYIAANTVGYSFLTDCFGYSMGILAVLVGSQAAFTAMRPKSNLSEQMFSESMGFPKKTNKLLNIFGFCIGASTAALGISYALSKSYDAFVFFATIGLGLIGHVSGNYVSMSEGDRPPPKREREPLWKRIKKYIKSWHPDPEPVTVED